MSGKGRLEKPPGSVPGVSGFGVRFTCHPFCGSGDWAVTLRPGGIQKGVPEPVDLAC